MTTKEQVLEIIKERLTMIGDSDFLTSHKATILNEILDIKRSIEVKVQEPKVKELVWEDDCAIAFKIDEDDYAEYCIGKNKQGIILYFDRSILKQGLDTLDQAKAYAQEHFEGLIRGCYE